ncbi:MAG: JAB domain-containing protein [bacterium]|nr:JAB domain-containing protein [bacterium]
MGCSKSFCKEEYGNFVQWASRALSPEDFALIPAWNDVKEWPGTIVGCCNYSVRGRNDLVLESVSEAARPESAPYRCSTDVWDEGLAYWWDLSEVVCFEQPIPCRGNVGMWQMPSDLADRVAATDQLARNVGVKISTAADAERIFRRTLPIAGGREGFFVLPLDAECRTLSEPVLVSLGDPTTTVIQPGEVFAVAFKTGAASVVLAHNHPSGDSTPSVQDRALTTAMSQIGDRIGIRVVDHLVVGGAGFTSAKDE